MAPGDQVTAGEQATADHEASAGGDPAVEESAGAEHTGESHDAAESAETIASAASIGGPVSVAAEAAGTTTAPAPSALIESVQIRRAITQAEKRTDLNWSVFIGTLGDDPRAQAEARHAELGPAAPKSVLIAVDPTVHRLEIVTGTHARTLLDDRSCALAAASMTSTFAVRDLDGGIAYGILAMVEHARRTRKR